MDRIQNDWQNLPFQDKYVNLTGNNNSLSFNELLVLPAINSSSGNASKCPTYEEHEEAHGHNHSLEADFLPLFD